MSTHDDAQRTLEKKALHNVRALIDNLEARDRRDARAGIIGIAAMLVIAAVLAAWALMPSPSTTRLVEAKPPGTATPELEAKKKQIEALDREIAEAYAAHSSRPKKMFVGTAKDTAAAPYVSAFVRKIEGVANANYPQELRGVHGTVQLTVGIKADGFLHSVEINRSSAIRVIDQAAVKFVSSAQPFDRFEAALARDVDILFITRTFKFEKGGVKEGK